MAATPPDHCVDNRRLLWVTEHYPPARGGMATSCDRIVRGLRAAGVDVDVVHGQSRSDVSGAAPLSVTRELGGTRIAVAAGDDPEHAAAALVAHVGAIAEQSAWTHVVAFGGVWSLCLAPVLAATTGAALVTLLRGNDLDTGIVSLRRRAVLDDAVRRAAAVGCVSRAQARFVARYWPGSVVGWTQNSIDLADWEPLPSERRQARTRIGEATDGAVVIGCFGHLKRKKGMGLLLDAVTAAGVRDAVHFVVVGDTEDAIADRLDGYATTRLPFCDRFELLSIMPACDLVALPSFYDGMPNVALEAAGLGLALLASTAGGLADLCDPPEACGWTFAPGDLAGATAATRAAVRASDAERRARGATARARVGELFTPAAEIAAHLHLLDAAAAAHSGEVR